MVATLVALTALSPWPRYSIALKGGGQGVRVPNSEPLELTGDLTLEAWIKPETADNGDPFHFIVSKNYGGTGYALLMIGHGDETRIQFEARDLVAYFVPMSVLKSRWWHVACVRGGGALRLFLNGIEVARRETNLRLEPNALPLYIGTSPWGSFAGEIADVRIWNCKRSQAQILDDMHSRIRGNEPGLVAEWSFGTVSRGRTYDVTHRTRPGELVGQARRHRHVVTTSL